MLQREFPRLLRPDDLVALNHHPFRIPSEHEGQHGIAGEENAHCPTGRADNDRAEKLQWVEAFVRGVLQRTPERANKASQESHEDIDNHDRPALFLNQRNCESSSSARAGMCRDAAFSAKEQGIRNVSDPKWGGLRLRRGRDGREEIIADRRTGGIPLQEDPFHATPVYSFR
jgi:hypothetical protein